MTLTEKLAAYFQERPDTWIDGMELARVAGSYAWRSRCSDLRRAPYGLVIENRVRYRHRVDCQPYACACPKVKVSEYRMVSAKELAA
jgi:hypothetical protein